MRLPSFIPSHPAIRFVTWLRGVKKPVDSNTREKQALSKLAYVSLKSEKEESTMRKETARLGYQFDPSLSSDETKVFVNPDTQKVVVAYRGTQLKDSKSRWKDLKSDAALAFGLEKYDKRFQESNKHFKKVKEKYPDYKLDLTGHSLGGQISKYVTDNNLEDVNSNITFSRGTGLLEPFRRKSEKTTDVSNINDIISMGARLQGGNQSIEYANKGPLESHNLQGLYR
jgi:hypothetical protein